MKPPAAPDGTKASSSSPTAATQTRYLAVFRDDRPDDADDFTHGFQMRRARINASGSVWDKNLTFKIEGEFHRNGGDFHLLDAWACYTWDSGVAIRFGQLKPFLQREDNVSDVYQLTAERSALNSVFGQNRTQGIEVSVVRERFRFFGTFFDGMNALNSEFDSPAESDFAVSCRVDYMFSGNSWKRFDDHTSFRGSEYAGMIGGGVVWQCGGETGGTFDEDIFQCTADVTVEGDGWNVFACGVWRNTDTPGGSFNDYGFLAQGGYFITEQCELFARYDVIVPDEGDNFNTATVGVNYYVSPNSHAVKVTGNVSWYFDPVSQTPILNTSTGLPLLADMAGDQVAFCMQVQLIH